MTRRLAMFVLLMLPALCTSEWGVGLSIDTSLKEEPVRQIEKLRFLVGDWTYTETYNKSGLYPNGGESTGFYTARIGPGGYSLVDDYHSTGSMGRFEGHDVIAWDPVKRVYMSYLFGSNFAGCYVRTAEWKADQFELVGDAPSGKSAIRYREVIKSTGPSSMTVTEFYRIDGGHEQPMLTVKAVKK